MGQNDRLKFQFRIEREKWEEWKQTVPQSTTLEEKVRELVLADLAASQEKDEDE